MNRYARWRYVLILVTVVLAVIYSLPNLFGEVPAVQVSPNSSAVPIDEKLMAEAKGERDRIRGAIDADTLRHYDRVLKFRGSAIAEAIDHRCAACQVMIRPQVYNELRSTEKFITCDSCQRILYYDPAHDSNPIPNRAAEVVSEEAEPAGNAAAQ